MEVSKCKFCNCSFPNKEDRVKVYCSSGCSQAQFRKNNPGKNKQYHYTYMKSHPKPCKRCKKPIQWEPNKVRTFCSSECRKKAERAKAKRYRDRAQASFSQHKMNLGCSKCGYNRCSGCLDFHHVNPVNKEFRITATLWFSQTPLVKSELVKCILLCKNCHYEEHFGGI